MLMKKFFVNYSTRKMQIENFIRKNFPNENYSNIELERTPLGVKIVIYTDRPGRIIGAGGRKINDMTEVLKNEFKLENPQIDVKSIRSADLDSSIVAKKIATALESGYNYKKIGNVMLKRIMNAGAIGCEIVMSGKLGGSKGRMGKFNDGYLKHCGQPAKELVDYGFKEANTRPGKIGIKVKIMMRMPIISEDVPQKEDKDKKTVKKKEAKDKTEKSDK
ncbi:MAG: 30S ribosomal protein S3 [Candidatus Aenigmarchaeota archaeon]|nr:30S ribosomal protein S3 [Candidatus Aenigmarchaeota archaeon]